MKTITYQRFRINEDFIISSDMHRYQVEVEAVRAIDDRAMDNIRNIMVKEFEGVAYYAAQSYGTHSSRQLYPSVWTKKAMKPKAKKLWAIESVARQQFRAASSVGLHATFTVMYVIPDTSTREVSP